MLTARDEGTESYWRNWLAQRGWHTWYHPDYWVHPNLVPNNAHDYTYYGMSMGAAIREQKKWEEE